MSEKANATLDMVQNDVEEMKMEVDSFFEELIIFKEKKNIIF